MGDPIFRLTYKLTNASENYIGKAAILVVGVRQVQRVPTDQVQKRNVVEFLKVGGRGHILFGKIEQKDDNTFELVDEIRKGNDGKPVVWKFERLTIENWTQMGEDIVGFARLRRQLVTDELLQNFYLADWLEDWWEEHPKVV